jgi:hypothetical protein
MATDENPLKSLIVEGNQNLDLHQLTDLLTDRIAFTADGDIQFLADFYEASNQQKMLIVLLGAKAKSILFEGQDGFTPSEIIAHDIMPLGSVKSTLKSLLEDTHEIKKSGEKRYYVPNYVIAKLASRLAKDVK